MIEFEGSAKTPQFWPGASLKGHGTNPAGDSIWRVVWAPSRTFQFGGRHVDRDSEGDVIREFVGYRHLPLYIGKECYVLERWLPATQYAKCNQEVWDMQQRDPDTGLSRLGPYPSRGEYFGPCWYFEGYPTISAVETVIRLIVEGDKYTPEQNRQAMIKAAETERVMQIKKAQEVVLDALPLRITDGLLSYTAMRNAADVPDKLSAQDVSKFTGLPLGRHKSFTSGTRRV